MAQTDVNTALCRVLAPDGMPECSDLAGGVCSAAPARGVDVPEHLRQLPELSPQLHVLAMGFSWARYCC